MPALWPSLSRTFHQTLTALGSAKVAERCFPVKGFLPDKLCQFVIKKKSLPTFQMNPVP